MREDATKTVYHDGDLYYNFMDALAAAWQQYTVINLIGQEMTYNPNYVFSHSDNGDYLLHTSSPNMFAEGLWQYLTIRSLLCSEQMMDGCVNTPTTINFANIKSTPFHDKEITFQNVIITTQKYFQYDSVSYCPVLTLGRPGYFITDQNTTMNHVRSSLFQCSLFADTSLFQVSSKAALRLTVRYTQNVTIKNVTIQPHAIINLQGGDAYLTNVSFYNVQPSMASGSHAIILQNQDCASIDQCGSLYYKGGSVQFLNNGYEISTSTRLNPFLRVGSLTNIIITNVTITLGIIGESTVSFGLIFVANFFTFSIADCRFENNLVAGRLINIQSTVVFPTKVSGASLLNIYSQTHLSIARVVFKSNFAFNGIIKVTMSGDLLNIAIHDCVFDGNALSNSNIIDISYTVGLTSDKMFGWFDIGSFTQIPARWLTISRIVFTHQASFNNLLNIDSCANVVISDVICSENKITGTQNIEMTMKNYINAEGTYAKVLPSFGGNATCTSLIHLMSVSSCLVTDLNITSNICTNGGTGLSIERSSGNLIIANITVTRNSADGSGGVALSCTGTESISVSNLTARYNSHGSFGVVLAGDSTSVLIEDSVFESNDGYTGAGLCIAYAFNITVVRTKFIRNTSPLNNGGGIYITPNFNARTQFVIKSCEFTSNFAMIGGAISLNFLSSASPLHFEISDTRFVGNAASDTGSSLYISSTVNLVSDSFIDGCTFSEEISKGGAITMLHIKGQLMISNSIFSHNYGTISSAINIQTESTAPMHLTNLTFSGNAYAYAVVKPNSLIYSIIISKNCKFTNNMLGSLKIENGLWSDENSQFLFTNSTAVQLTSSSVAILRGTQFRSNVGSSNAGGMSLASNSYLNCSACTFTNNSAAKTGGAIFSEQGSALLLSDCLFENNKATESGSAIYILSSISVMTVIIDTQFRGNSAGNTGTIYAQISNLMLFSVTMEANTAVHNPGVELLISVLYVTNCTFRAQTGDNAPFVILQVGSTAVVTGSRFSTGIGNESGCFFMFTSTLNVTNTTIEDVFSGSEGVLSAYGTNTVYIEDLRVKGVNCNGTGSIASLIGSKLWIVSSEFRDYCFGGVYGISMELVEMRGTKFVNGQGDGGGAFYCESCPQVVIDSCEFSKINSTQGAVYIHESASVTISNSQFINNTSQGCGCLYTDNARLTIANSKFEGNSASDSDGGCLCLDCTNTDLCQYTINESEFQLNSANRSGGAIYWKVSKPKIENVTFEKNTASYGPNFASFPIKLRIAASRLLQNVSSDFSGIPPGQVSNAVISAMLIDHYGQVVNIDSESSAQLVSGDGGKTTVSGITKVSAQKGIYTFTNITLFADPKTQVNLMLVSTAIPDNNPNDENQHQPILNIAFQMRDCVPGESIGTKSCLVCASGTYGFDPSKPCQNCLSNAKCLGKTVVLPNSGYWRSGIYSEKVWECPLPSSCLGGNPYDNGTVSVEGFCSSGYKSNMCQSCADEYSRSSKNKCGKCPELEINIVRIVFVTIAVVIFNAYLVYGAMKSATRPTALHSIYMKILVNYLQLVFLVTEFNLSWPQPVLDLFNAQENTGGVTEQIYSIDCFLSGNGDTSNVFYRKMIFMALLPFFVIAAIIVFWVAISAYTKDTKYLKRELAASIVIAFFFIHPTLTKSLFSMFSCTQINAGEYWLTVDMAIKCYSPEYLFYIFIVGIPAVTVWVFAVPLFCLGILIKFRRQQDELWLKLQYGFLINGYRRERYYWEFVVLFRKIAIICCSVFLTNSVNIQALTVQLILLFFYLLQHDIHPYTHFQLNSTESKGIIVADVTIYCGLYYLTDDLSEGSSWFFFALIVLFNAVFLIYWFFAVIGFFIDIFAGIFPSIGHKIRPEIFERDPYIDDFITTIEDKDSNRYNNLQVPNSRNMFKVFLRRSNPFENAPRNISAADRSYQPVMPMVHEDDFSKRSDSEKCQSPESSSEFDR